jgi:hypothetical protein
LVGAFPAKAAGQHDQELFEIGIERRMHALLNAELDPHGHGFGRANHVDALLDLLERDVGCRRPLLDGNAQQGVPHLAKSDRVLLQKLMVDGVAP